MLTQRFLVLNQLSDKGARDTIAAISFRKFESTARCSANR